MKISTGGSEVYEHRFFYAGMRQVVIRGTARPPALEDLTGCLVSMGWSSSGSFRCSDDVANWLNDATRRTVEAYTTFLPNDPVREWKAWTEDIENMSRSSAFLFDSQTMYERWQWAMVETQREDGNCRNVTPGAYFDGYNSPWWGGCVVWLPWQWYQYYGDNSLLKESFPAMKRYVDYLGMAAAIPGEYSGSITTEEMQDWGLADWCPDPSGPGLGKIIIKPNIVGDLHWDEGFYDSVQGRIISNWHKRGTQLVMDVTIPSNTTATVFVPANDAANIAVSGNPVDKVKGVKFLHMENNSAVYSIVSGNYRFQ
ncbi:MAG: alpha-L-rhamnosidase C-terminal domain-containing protein [Bacteroidales bacterium]